MNGQSKVIFLRVLAAQTPLLLRLFAPYLAVGVFWCGFSSAWLAILAYHAQILIWSHRSLRDIRKPSRKVFLLLALPTVLAGPLLYLLLPCMTRTDLSVWLAKHHLSGVSFMAMIPYFGLVHPYLEQVHWGPLRERTILAHPLFAGYHLLVLYSLLTVPWLALCFVVLTMASYLWQTAAKRSGSLAVPVVSHILADLGVVVSAWLKM